MDSQEVKIRKGQAFNLAVATAIEEGNHEDVGYIYSKFLYYYDLAALLQSTDPEDLQKVLNNKNVDDIRTLLKCGKS